ncbi:MAG: hypothetical protein ACLUHA_06815 [Bacteroides stercoris]
MNWKTNVSDTTAIVRLNSDSVSLTRSGVDGIVAAARYAFSPTVTA